MAPRIRRLGLVALAVGSTLALPACGSSSPAERPAVVHTDNGEAAKNGPQVMKDAAAAMTAAGAVHISGLGNEGIPPQKESIDGHVQSEGLTMSVKSAAGEEDFIAVGKTNYTKSVGSGSVLPASLAKKYANRWIKVSGDPATNTGTAGASMSFSFDDPTIAGLGKSLSIPDGGGSDHQRQGHQGDAE